MLAMVDGETGNHRVETANFPQRVVQVVFDNRNVRPSRKTLAGSLQHGWREVDADALSLRARLQHQRKQSPVSATQVKHPTDFRRENLDKDLLTFRSVRNLVGPAQTSEGVVVFHPLIHV